MSQIFHLCYCNMHTCMCLNAGYPYSPLVVLKGILSNLQGKSSPTNCVFVDFFVILLNQWNYLSVHVFIQIPTSTE